jgi:hypothetical protein
LWTVRCWSIKIHEESTGWRCFQIDKKCFH